MNIDLEKTFSFSSILADPDAESWINHYDVRVQMRTTCDNSRDYNIAYARMKFWFANVMQDAVLIENNDHRLKSWRDTGLRCLDFPEYPVDQVVGLMLMSKLTAIAEDRMEILRLSVTSPSDDYVTYFCDQEDYLHWFEEPGWWKDSGPNYSTAEKKPRSHGKVIAISRVLDWKDHQLDWSNDTNNTGNISVLPNRDQDA